MARHSQMTYWIVAAIGENRLAKSYVKVFYSEEQAVSFAQALNCKSAKFVVFKREETETIVWSGEKPSDEKVAAGIGDKK